MSILISVLIGVLILVYLLVRVAMAVSEEMGKLEEQKDRLKKDKELADKRAAEMLKEKTRGEVVDDLRNGKF